MEISDLSKMHAKQKRDKLNGGKPSLVRRQLTDTRVPLTGRAVITSTSNKVYTGIKVLNDITAMEPLAQYVLEPYRGENVRAVFERRALKIVDTCESAKVGDEWTSNEVASALFDLIFKLGGDQAVVDFFNLGISSCAMHGLIVTPHHGPIATFGTLTINGDKEYGVPFEVVGAALDFADAVIASVHNLYDVDEQFADTPLFTKLVLPLREDFKHVELEFSVI